MANSRDYEELLYTWRSWRDNIGLNIRPKYIKYMEQVNETATAIGIFLFFKFNLTVPRYFFEYCSFFL